MSLDAVAAVKIPIERVRAALGPGKAEEPGEPGFESLTARNGVPVLVRPLADATLVFTGASLRETEPDELGFLVRQLLGDLVDEPGCEILAFPDVVHPKANSWSELVDELGDAADRVPIVPADHVPERFRQAPEGSLEAAMAGVMSALGPDLGSLSRAVFSGDANAMQEAQQKVQELLAKPEGAALLSALGQLDLDALGKQAEAVLGKQAEDDEDPEK